MDARVNTCCPKCSQPFALFCLNPLKGRIPLLLPCSHSVCDGCVRNTVKFKEPLQCQLCERCIELTPEQTELVVKGDHMWKIFPINLCLFGELSLQLAKMGTKTTAINDTNTYINLEEIILSAETDLGKCNECTNATRSKCVQCDTIYCDTCFQKVHSAFHSLKMHTKEAIGMTLMSSACPSHSDKTVDYYCETCRKPLCVDCLFLGELSCSSHKLMSMKEKNSSSMDKLKDMHDAVDEIYRRLTKTAVDIGNKLHTILTDSDSQSKADILASALKQHFAKLHGVIQKLEDEKLSAIGEMKSMEKASLEAAKTEIASHLKTAKTLLHKLNFVQNNPEIKVNVEELLVQSKDIINTSWYLHKPDCSSDGPSFKVNSEVFELLESHLSVGTELGGGYKLLPTSDVAAADLPPAPPRPVYPPEIVRDVRELDKKHLENKVKEEKTKENKSTAPHHKHQPSIDKVPKFRPKSESVSSNSLCSEESGNGDKKSKRKTQEILPMTLEEGSQELVYVIHINHPGDFYVQRDCLAGKRNELKKLLHAASSLPRPNEKQICEGGMFLGYCKMTNQFQRCRILSISTDDPSHIVYYVFYIDRGQTDNITIKDLRVMQRDAARLPALALHCTLANVQPLGGVWDQADSLLMHSIVSNKQSVMFVRRTLGATNLGLALECDLTTFDEVVNLARAFVFHGRARYTDPNYKYPKVGLLEERASLFHNSDMRKGSTEEVFITCIVNPDKFYVRKSYLQEQFEKLCTDLDNTYAVNDKAGTVYCPEVGAVVACNVETCAEVCGGGWRRGEVTELQGRGRVRVALPDSGHELELHYTSLRILRSQFFTVKALAVECHLSQISPSNRKWSRNSVALLEQFTQRPLQARVLEPAAPRRSVGVVLYDRHDADHVVCVNQRFIEEKCAVNIGALTFDLPNSCKPVQNKAPKERKPAKPKPKPVITLLQKQPLAKNEIKDEDLLVKLDKGPSKLEVRILSCQSPSMLYLSLVYNKETLSKLFSNLQIYYDNASLETKDDWKPEDRCCVLHNKSKTWRRAVILHMQDETARIFYTDFAVVEEVKLSELKVLVEEFTKVRDGALKCHLSGIMPAGGSDWPGISCEYLNENIESYQRFFITLKGNIKDKSIPVELWVYHVTPGGALDADRGEWRLLNDQLLRQGLALPDRESDDEPRSDDTLSLLPSTGGVSEWLQLRPASVAEAEPAERSDSDSERASPEPTAEPSAAAWLPAEPITEDSFEAVPTFVDDEGCIYLHHVSHEDTLDIISKSLEAHFKVSKRRPASWSVGESCVALYGLDNKFHRGVVVQIHDETSCLVRFIDYGNAEICNYRNMSKELLPARIPIQATRCSLVGINFVGGKKRLDAVEYMHQLIVDRRCSVRVLDRSEDILKIELKIANQNICYLLVEMQFATPVNVASPNSSFNDNRCNDSFIDNSDVDSGPDYIIEEDDPPISSAVPSAGLPVPDPTIDWNQMIDAEETRAGDDERIVPDGLRYRPTDVPGDSFKCTVMFVERFTQLQLVVSQRSVEEEAALAAVLEEVRAGGEEQPPLARVARHQACVARYGADGEWYRATVLREDRRRGLVKVLYVDFGNTERVAAKDVRESRRRWCEVPARALAARLHGVRATAAAVEDGSAEHAAAYRDLLLEREVLATVVCRAPDVGAGALQVELRAEPGAPLLYQPLIDKGLLLCEP